MATPEEKRINAINKKIAQLEAQLSVIASDNELINSELEKLLTVETREAAENSLYSFYSQAWSVFETVPFLGNWHLRCICEHLEAVFRGDIQNIIFMVPPRHSKLLAKSTPILTPDGWTTHGKLKEGDSVYHPSGEITKVKKVHPDDIANIEITFSNGEKIKCNEDHLWQVYDRNRHRLVVENTKSLYEIWSRSNKERCQLLLPNIKPLEKQSQNLIIHPYFLGLWLGDGTKNKPCITHDVSDIESIKKLENLGFRPTTTTVHKQTGVLTTYFSHQNIHNKLKQIKVWNNKNIPSSYINSSIEQRCELIAGLIDSDGHVDLNGRVRIINTNKAIIDGAYEILLSLGQRPYIEEREPVDSTTKWGIKGKLRVYSLGFQPTIEFPTAIPRKEISRLVVQRKVGITKIEYLRDKDVEVGNCITVDAKDGMYLCGKNLLPTHNSSIINIAFPVWCWLHSPQTKFITAAHGESLAVRDSVKSRQLIDSPWFQRNWGERVKLKLGVNQKMKYENEENGYRIATSIGGRGVGEGFDCQTPYTKILTNKGPIKIEELYSQQDLSIEVFCYDTDRGLIKKIKPKKYLRSTLRDREIVRITFKDGSYTDCTADHKWYTAELGYVEAQDLIGWQGRSELLCLPNKNNKETQRLAEIQEYNLQSNMQQNKTERIPTEESSNSLQALQERNTTSPLHKRQSKFLFGDLPKDTSAIKNTPQNLSYLQQRIPTQNEYLLQQNLFESGTLSENKGSQKSQLSLWGLGNEEKKPCPQKVQKLHSRAQASNSAERQFYLPGLQQNRRSGGQGFSGTPYQFKQEGQQSDKPYKSLSILSWEVSSTGLETTYKEVEAIQVLNNEEFSSSYYVYTLSMPPYGNYFVVPEGSNNPVLAKNCLVVDDPHKPSEINSAAALNNVLEWWTGTMPSRANSPTSKRIVMHQRLAEGDLIGHILENEEGIWEVIKLPMEYEPTEFTSVIGWSDPRKQEGEVLWPERFPPFEVSRLKKELGSYGYAAQYQQRPAAKEGGIIKKDWFNYYPTIFSSYTLKDFQLVIQSWDLSFGNTGDYTVGQVWGRRGPNKYLLDQVRGKWTFTEQLREIRNLNARWPQTRIILVENAANGAAAIDTLKREIPGLIPINPKEIGGGDKETRVSACSLDFESGNIYVPSHQIAPWVGDYIHELTTFPRAKNDDQCFPKGTQVRTSEGLKSIETVKEGDLVLDNNNEYSFVTNTFKNKTKKLVKIKVPGSTEPHILTTENHPFAVVDRYESCYGRVAPNYKTSAPWRWKEAKDIQKYDCLLETLPTKLPKESKDPKIKINLASLQNKTVNFNEDGTRFRLGKNGRHWYPTEITLENSFYKLLGYYLAEGCLSDHGVNFCFHQKEVEYHQEVIDLLYDFLPRSLSIKIYYSKQDNGCVVYCNSYVAQSLFKYLCPGLAGKKRIPINLIKTEKQAINLLQGLHNGDGSIYKSGFTAVSTISKDLAHDTRQLLFKIGIASYYSVSRSHNRNPLYSVTVYQSDNQKVNEYFNLELKVSKRKLYAIYEEKYFGKRVQYVEIQELEKEEEVYNLEINGSHTYYVEDFLVHNCDSTAMALNWFAAKGGNTIALMASQDELRDLNRVIPSKYTQQTRNPNKKGADFSSAPRSIVSQNSIRDLKNIF